ncbi:hypothetical protein SteCoe_741 [Stentor coeruleus]|uniref:DOMON domain-containing protein n=1 Tax=Stentor coeruleus TaxID=5963 RepID=A0A1R2D3K0_9CILI|nr:hypothetical protein SteCoe_741 [Stentor coeruleus]
MKAILLTFILTSGIFGGETLNQTIDSVMTMEWNVLDNEWIQIRLLCKIKLGYCSIGLRSSMTNCDMFAALTDGENISLIDYWSRDHGTPRDDISEGGTEDIVKVSGGVDASGNIDITFKRKLNTGDKYDQQIYPDIKGNICWGYRNNHRGWTEHTNYGDAGFAWASTKANMYFSSTKDTKYNHGVAMSVSWSCLAVIGIFVSRYFKYTSWWIYIHTIPLLIASLITIISSSNIYKDDQYPTETISEQTLDHSRIGMIMSSIVIAQCIFGMMYSYFKIFTKNVQALTFMVRAHKVIGYALLIIGLINCFKGWDIYNGKTGIGLTILGYVITVVAFIGFDVYQIFFKNRRQPASPKLPITTHSAAMEMIANGSKLMFADDMVLDVGGFMLSHPGGSFMISECIGEDTGKYMVGCSSYGGAILPYTHSNKAFSYFKNLAISRIPTPEGYLYSPTNNNHNQMEFALVSKKALNDSTFLIYLKSDDFKMAVHCQDPSWIGKHFMILHSTRLKTVRRYYSTMFVDLIEWSTEIGLTQSVERVERVDDGLVKFIYKVYPGGYMTNHMNSLNIGEVLNIKGPYGPGLMLSIMEGNYLAFGGGTGLVPFLDLIYYAWKVGCNENKFKLTVFAFFRSWKDGFALDLLEKMRDTISPPWLKIHILLDDNVEQTKQIPELVKSYLDKEVTYAWICGPSGFNRYYHGFLLKNGVEKSKIILM